MAGTITFLDEEKHRNCCDRVGVEDNGRNRKRRRPQHEQNENPTPLSSREHSSRRQKTEAINASKTNRCGGRYKRSRPSPLLFWIVLLFACSKKFQCSIPSVLAIKLRERTKYQTDMLQQKQERFLQIERNSLSLPAPTIDYLELPMSLWTSKGSSDQFLEGNSIRVSPFDEDILYAINWMGNLRIFSATNGKSIDTVSPSPRTLTEEGATSTWDLNSNSGMAFGSYSVTTTAEENVPGNNIVSNKDDQSYNDYLEFLLNNGIQQNEETKQSHFVVYSIIDKAPAVSRFLPKTRVVCVSIPEHKILWTSAGLPGTPNGSPLVYYADEATMSQNGKMDDDTSDMYIVLTHNSVLVRPDNSTRTTGHLTVLNPLNGHVEWTQSEWSRDEIPKGYGLPQLSRSPILGGGNSGGSFGNKNDVIVWTSNDQEGRGFAGSIYSFQMKSRSELKADIQNKNNGSDGQNEQNDPFEIRVLKNVRWNSIARPAINRNGTQLYIGMTGNAVRGWNGIAKFNETANWATRLVAFDDSSDASLPPYSEDVAISTAPVLSADEERLFATTIRNEMICLNTKTGSKMWTNQRKHSSPILSEPKASPDNERLYIIMSLDGKVHAINQRNGKSIWGFGCDENNLAYGNKCKNPTVSADFDLSNDGTILYYASSDGRVVALTLGHRAGYNKGSSPSISTTPATVIIDYDEDDRGPLEFDMDMEFDRKAPPTFDSIPQPGNDNNRVFGAKLAGTIIAIIVSLSIAFVSVMYVVKSKGIDWRNYRLPRYGSSGGKRHAYVTRVGRRRSDGPDLYEDRIIASLSEDEESIEQQFNTLWVDPTHSNPKLHIPIDDESPTADRLSVLLGTSNKIAPIMDNFGFGQAVLI